jgi:hypothetical protein
MNFLYCSRWIKLNLIEGYHPRSSLVAKRIAGHKGKAFPIFAPKTSKICYNKDQYTKTVLY